MRSRKQDCLGFDGARLGTLYAEDDIPANVGCKDPESLMLLKPLTGLTPCAV